MGEKYLQIERLVVLCFLVAPVFIFMPVRAQKDDAASKQHSLLGQRASGAVQFQSKPNIHPAAQWFPKAGFGLFVHLGIAAVHGGIDLSWPMLANKSWEDATITPHDYWALADRWNPKKFRPDVWVKQAKRAGFRYIVLVTKHHDGYTMWPSEYGTLGVKQKLGGRDLVREFVDACRKYDMRIGLYYSPPDWYFDAPYRNWDASGRSILDTCHKQVKTLPKKPAGHDEKRKEMVRNQVRELLTDYGKIDIMWFDGGHGEISNDEVRRLQPGIIVNRRNGELGDFGDSEGVLPTKRFTGWFECNDPCWPSRWWGYSTCDRMDTGNDVIEKLVLMRAWGGNYLANVGPCGDGSMPEEAILAWKEIGEWMKHSGESVYDITGGTFPEKANLPVTLKGDSIMYLHAFPGYHMELMVRDVKRKPVKAILLRTGEEFPLEYENGTLKVYIPPYKRTRQVDTVKVYF